MCTVLNPQVLFWRYTFLSPFGILELGDPIFKWLKIQGIEVTSGAVLLDVC